jgi:hypothetical protein
MELTAKRRDHLAKAVFGLPAERSYPMPDREHAANAKARAKQELDAGRLSQSQYDQIVAKANKVLGER